MARQVRRISELPEATELTGDEQLEIVQDGENHRLRVDQLSVGDAVLRQDLADPDKGAAMVITKQEEGDSSERSVRDYMGDRVSVLDYGAVGDGVSDDTEAFRKVESTRYPVVDLAGRTFIITPYWQDTANGIFLTKDYRNGSLIVGGRSIVFDNSEGMARAGAVAPTLPVPSTGKKLGLTRVDENNYNVFRPLGGRYWANYYLQRSEPGLPFNLHGLWINQFLAFRAADEPGVTVTGSNTSITSSSATLYVNGRARRMRAVGASVEVEFYGGGDLFAVFYAREDSNHIKVELDSSNGYLVLPVNDSGDSYFDAYSSPISAKKIIQVASGVPVGTHTLRLTVLSEKNPENTSGNNFWFNAIAWDGDSVGPWDEAARASNWKPGESVLAFQERYHRGRYYYAAEDGTTGPMPPTHTSGTVSDGGVDWVYRGGAISSSSYFMPRHRIQGPGSQVEYAYMTIPDGASTAEDVGGQAHGNERQTSYRWLANGSEVSVDDGFWVVADTFEIQERIESFHSQIEGGNTTIGHTTLRRRFSVPYMEISHSHTLTMQAQWGWYYPHMWPLMHYNSASGGYTMGILDMWSPCGNKLKCEDYYYSPENPPYQDDTVEITKDYVMVATGYALQPLGSMGNPSKVDTGLRFHAWLQVDPAGLDFYQSGSRTFASKSMNMSNKNPVTIPADSMICKMYFMRFDGNNRVSLPAGAVIESTARYGFAITAS